MTRMLAVVALFAACGGHRATAIGNATEEAPPAAAVVATPPSAPPSWCDPYARSIEQLAGCDPRDVASARRELELAHDALDHVQDQALAGTVDGATASRDAARIELRCRQQQQRFVALETGVRGCVARP